MFWDDVQLVSEMVAKHSGQPPYVEAGGIENPTIAAYEKTIEAMAALSVANDSKVTGFAPADCVEFNNEIRAAQMCRYLQIRRPLEASCPGYRLEDPAAGGVPIELLHNKYGLPESAYCTEPLIGTAILLSVLEHVDNPFWAIEQLHLAMRPGGLVIASVPFIFPYHPDCGQDNFRFTPSGLRSVFGGQDANDSQRLWDIIEAGWRLDIPSEAGVLDIKTGRAQAIRSCYLVARAVGG